MIRNITLSIEESAIAAMREYAKEENTTLNALFREWVYQECARRKAMHSRTWERDFDALMERLSYIKIGHMPTREERNAR